jgi:hypothetical protein
MAKKKVPDRQTSLSILLTISLTTISLFPTPSLLAETKSEIEYSKAPLNLELLKNPQNSVITANTIEQGKLTVPSLWRAKDNTESKLLDNWLAYPATDTEPPRVDLIVNQQIWSFLDYVERYDFVNRFSTAVRNEGYNVRVFSNQQEFLATYTCNFNKIEPFFRDRETLCNIKMNPQDKLTLSHCPWFLAVCDLSSVTPPIPNSPSSIKP